MNDHYNTEEEFKISFYELILDYIGWGMIIGLIIFLKLNSRVMENIVEGKMFILQYGGVGLSFAILYIVLMRKLAPKYLIADKKRASKRASAIIGQFVGILGLVLFGTAVISSENAKTNAREEVVTVESASMNTRYRTPYLRLKINGKEERFSPKSSEWKNIQAGDSIRISIGDGGFGFEHILSFTPMEVSKRE